MDRTEALIAPYEQAKSALAERICSALIANGYATARYAATADEAADIVFGMIPEGCSVGIPGSVTVRQLGLDERLAEKGCTVHHHWKPNLTPEERAEIFTCENDADWFITGSNAMTYDGRMINIDGTGNRVAGISWGRGKLLFIVSINKAEIDLDSAISRARNIAAPANSLRVKGETPCTLTGRCSDCNSPDRICRVLTIIERVPNDREAHVILVGEELGY